MKKISVIMPIYNAEKNLYDTISSVLNQTFSDFDLLLINDGSTDNTEKICLEFAKNNNLIKYYKLKNGGVSRARNFGLQKADSQYITFIDSDDFYKEDYLEVLYEGISSYPKNSLLVCGYEFFGKINKEITCTIDNKNQMNKKIELLQNKILFNQLWNKIYDLSVIKDNKIKFNENIDLGEDAIFNIEYLFYCNDIFVINKNLYKYRITDSGLGFKYRKNAGELKLYIFRKMYELYKINKYNMDYIEKNIIKQYISWSANIVDKKNNDDFLKKMHDIGQIKKNKFYNYDLSIVTDIKYKLIFLFLKNKIFSYFIGVLANKYKNSKSIDKIYN